MNDTLCDLNRTEQIQIEQIEIEKIATYMDLEILLIGDKGIWT